MCYNLHQLKILHISSEVLQKRANEKRNEFLTLKFMGWDILQFQNEPMICQRLVWMSSSHFHERFLKLHLRVCLLEFSWNNNFSPNWLKFSKCVHHLTSLSIVLGQFTHWVGTGFRFWVFDFSWVNKLCFQKKILLRIGSASFPITLHGFLGYDLAHPAAASLVKKRTLGNNTWIQICILNAYFVESVA